MVVGGGGSGVCKSYPRIFVIPIACVHTNLRGFRIFNDSFTAPGFTATSATLSLDPSSLRTTRLLRRNISIFSPYFYFYFFAFFFFSFIRFAARTIFVQKYLPEVTWRKIDLAISAVARLDKSPVHRELTWVPLTHIVPFPSPHFPCRSGTNERPTVHFSPWCSTSAVTNRL